MLKLYRPIFFFHENYFVPHLYFTLSNLIVYSCFCLSKSIELESMSEYVLLIVFYTGVR
jgi:hypothetical protein